MGGGDCTHLHAIMIIIFFFTVKNSCICADLQDLFSYLSLKQATQDYSNNLYNVCITLSSVSGTGMI